MENKNEYNILIIGNSITKHGICEYWWNEVGMAATTAEEDYVHLLIKGLSKQVREINSFSYNFSLWETALSDRSQKMQLIDNILTPYLDLIVVQLGENVHDTETFERDFSTLLDHIRDVSFNAEIIVVGNFWENSKVESIKKNVAKERDVLYVDLQNIWNDKEYQAVLGAKVYGQDGNWHIIEDEGVAIHPGNKGMQYIANAILNMMKENNVIQ